MNPYTYSVIIDALIAIWIYLDATKRNQKQAWLWGLFGFLLGLIGLAIYYFAVIRKNRINQ